MVAAQPCSTPRSGVTGQVIDSNQIQQLPLGDGTAYMLTRLAPGHLRLVGPALLAAHGQRQPGRASWPTARWAATSSRSTARRTGSRPTTRPPATTAASSGFSPPSDAIAEFKVQTNAFDAQSGQTAGRVGEPGAQERHQRLPRQRSAYFNRERQPLGDAAAQRARGRREADPRLQPLHRRRSPGPIMRDRTFFMVSFEHLRDVQPEPSTYTVPTVRMRQGDFSEFGRRRSSTRSRRRAPPTSARPSPATSFPPAASTPWPPPTRRSTPSPTGRARGQLLHEQLRPYDYNAVLGRIDHNFDSNNKLFVTGYWNKRQEDRYNWALGAANATGEGVINGFEVTQRVRLPQQHGRDHGLHLHALEHAASSTCARPTRSSASAASPRRSSTPRRSASRRRRWRLMGDYQYLPFITFGGFSTDERRTRASRRSARSAPTGTRASTGRSPTSRSPRP